MTISVLLFFLIVLLLLVLSVRERIKWRTMRNKDWETIGEAKSSPLSQALVSLVGTAGGIYLSLILLQTFLEMDVPSFIHVGAMELEPLATVSIALAILQPFLMRFWFRRKFR